MNRNAMALAALLLAGCVHDQNWARFDGRPLDPQQYSVDAATCRAIAVNAGNGVPLPAPDTRVTMTNTVNNTVVVQARPTNTYMVGNAPNYDKGDMSPQLYDMGSGIGRGLGAAVQRHRTEEANMQACMAQRGYVLAR